MKRFAHKIEFESGFNPIQYVAVDVEATGLDVWGGRKIEGVPVEDMPFCVSMCDEQGRPWYCEWIVDPFTRKVKPNVADVLFIRSLIKGKGVIFHNSKYDCRMLWKVGIDVVCLASSIEDTLFMARVCNTLELMYDLKYLSKIRLGIPNDDEAILQTAVKSARNRARRYNNQARKDHKPLILAGKDVKEDYWLPAYFARLDGNKDLEQLNREYCCRDTFRTMGLFRYYSDVMSRPSEVPNLRDTYEREMRRVWPIVNDMEEIGIRVFPDALAEESKKCAEAMIAHKSKMQKIINELGLRPYPEKNTAIRLTPGGRISRAIVKEPEFNPSSSQQLQRILYLPVSEGGLGIEAHYARKGKNKGISLTVDKDTLHELQYVEFVRELIGFRSAAHTKSLFFDPMPARIKIHSNGYSYIHPSFNQCGTKTGRFSGGGSGEFNAQQAGAGGKKSLGGGLYSTQKIFGPREGNLWLGYDYSQQEGTIFASLAGVELMLDALSTGRDMFEAMANSIWGGKGNDRRVKAGIIALELFKENPTPEAKAIQLELGWTDKNRRLVNQNDPFLSHVVDGWLSEFDYDIVKAEASLHKEASRQRCKHITYAKIFGGGPGSFAHLMMCSVEEARVFDNEYNSSMPEMKRYMKQLEKQAARDGYIVNLYGRKLRVDYNFAYRAVSYMIQGSAADMMKSSMIKVSDWLTETGLRRNTNIALTIHDELKIETPKSNFTTGFALAIASKMLDVEDRVSIPMKVGLSVCRNRWSVDEEEYKITDDNRLVLKSK